MYCSGGSGYDLPARGARGGTPEAADAVERHDRNVAARVRRQLSNVWTTGTACPFQRQVRSYTIMISWMFFPKSDAPNPLCVRVVEAFQKHEVNITSATHTLDSNAVLVKIASDLAALGFTV